MYCEIVYVSVCVFVYTFVPSRTGCIQAHCIYFFSFYARVFYAFFFVSFFYLFFFYFFFFLLSIKRTASFLAPLSINERTIFFLINDRFKYRQCYQCVSRDFHLRFSLFLTLSLNALFLALSLLLTASFHSPKFLSFLLLFLSPTFFLSLVLSLRISLFFVRTNTVPLFVSYALIFIYMYIYI